MKIKKIKLVTILGTRPEIIRLSRIIPKAEASTSKPFNFVYLINSLLN